jgi:TolB-like protein/DNA-binding winged helix-turn-helix (wHTH) protein/Flp pilus assembly protein TadD
MPAPRVRETFRFHDYELDVAAYELRRQGRPVRLERQPMELLILMVERRSELLSHGDIVERLWGKDVFVDVEAGVHTAIRKVRQALRDSSETPACVATVPGKGYRFIAPVQTVPAPQVEPSPIVEPEAPAAHAFPPADGPSDQRTGRGGVRRGLAVGAAAILVLAGLAAWARLRAPAAPSRVTIGVLPFENLSRDTERAYLADGLAEETIASFGQMDPEHLRVIGRTSTLAYKGTRKSLADIGRELGADYLVESSLRTEGDHVVVTSRLVRVRDQTQVWSETYDREPTSMIGLQRELSAAIADQIRLRLSPERLNALSRRHTRNPEAYDLYLRGRYFWNQLTPATNTRAIEYFERSIALDPDYALAWAGISQTLVGSPINGDADPREVAPRAREAALRAVRAGPDLAEAHVSLGMVHFYLDWDWPAAEASFRRAVASDPGFALADRYLGHVLSQEGQHAEAAQVMRRACELDPLYAMNHAISSQVAYQARDYPLAVAHARRALLVNPGFWIGHVMLGQGHEAMDEPELALESFDSAARFSQGNSKALSFRGYLLARLGRKEEAREVLRALQARAGERYVPPYAMALVHLGLGEREAALARLEEAYQARDIHLVFLPVDAKWDTYRTEPRFRSLLARCGFTVRGDATR